MVLHLGTDPETDEPVDLPAEALLRHAVILGATGAGKTVLGKALVEEAVRAGVPVIAVDPQGDLASLALAPTQASLEDHPVPESVVAGYWSRASVSILTPGSTRGRPVALNPLKSAPRIAAPEDRIVALDALAESLAGAMGYDLESDVGGRAKDALFLALQAALAADEWPRDLPRLVMALERSAPAEAAKLLTKREWSGLVRRAQSMSVGAKGLLFTQGTSLDVESLLSWAPKGRVPVNVVYTGGLRSARDRELVVATLCKDVLAWMTSNPSGELRLVVYIDEVAGLCPPHPRNPPAKKFLSLLFRQARKYGVGVVVATQNVTDLDYKALGQAGTWALGRLMAKQDLERVRHVVAAVHRGPPEDVLGTIPSLKAGEFILLAPDHVGVSRLRVRGLATLHAVVPEERFREIQAMTAPVAPKPAAASPILARKDSRRLRLATEATRAAGAELDEEVQEGIGLRILRLFEDAPGLYGADEVASMVPAEPRFLEILLRKLADHRLLRAERMDGRDVYWDPTVGLDPRRGAPAHVSTLPLRFPLVAATKRLREHLRHRMFVIPKETVVRKDFYYLPLWRVEAEVDLGRKAGKAARQFYVNAVTGDLAHAVYGRVTFEEFPRKTAIRLEPLAPKSLLERVPSRKVGDPIPVARIGPSQSQEIVRRTLGVKPLAGVPDFVLLPIWRFDVQSKGSGQVRSLWLEATFGSVFREPP